jgi:5-methylcytosine-specific restriction endonuclease McrA/predicted nucleic acid-binding Zn ribbon protein
MAGFFCSGVAVDRQCVVCLNPINHANRLTQTCGAACGKVLSDRTRTENARTRNERNCLRCGRLFQKTRNSAGSFCSRSCSADARRVYPDKAEAKRAEYARSRSRRGIPEPTMAKCACGEMFLRRDHRHLFHSDDCRSNASDVRDRSPRACGNAACGKVFGPAYGEKNRVFCSTDCLKEKHTRVERAARRAKEAGVEVEPGLDPFDIFERDGWRCYICGEPTPKALRGTRHPKAPELEHVTPIASGGPHTRENTACACKVCNFKKGNGEVEQPGYMRPDWRLLTA